MHTFFAPAGESTAVPSSHSHLLSLLAQERFDLYPAAVRPAGNTAAGRRIQQQGALLFQAVQNLRGGVSVAVYSSSESDTIPLWSKDSPLFFDEKVKEKAGISGPPELKSAVELMLVSLSDNVLLGLMENNTEL